MGFCPLQTVLCNFISSAAIVVYRFLTFIGPCIIIYFYSKTTYMQQFLKFILFCSSILHVSDGHFAHHQESKTVHTASGICQTDSADCLLAKQSADSSKPKATWVNTTRYCKYSQVLLMMGKTSPETCGAD
jgi:hypothetical protein